MDSRLFLDLCKEKVENYYSGIGKDNVYVVWHCKTLQNSKALLSTNVPDGRYFECTYNGDKRELYLDAYKKEQNICYKNVEKVIDK